MQVDQTSKIPVLHVDVWYSKLPDSAALNNSLLTEIRVHKAEDERLMPYTNPGCWRGEKRYKCEQDLFSRVRAQMKTILMSYPLDINPDALNLSIEYWTNVNSRGGSNQIHSHNLESSDWSGCYYIQSTGTGAIRFYTEQCLHQQIKPYMPFGATVEIFPEDGDLVMFPSYLLHEVMPNPGDRERINIAFNITFTARV